MAQKNRQSAKPPAEGKRPIGVTILCVLQFVAVAAQMTLATLVLFGWRGLEGLGGAGADRLDVSAILSGWRPAPVLLAVAALQGTVAYGLWTLRNWARMLVILLLAVNVVADVVVLVMYGVIWPDAAITLGALVKGAASVLVIRYLAAPDVRGAFRW